MRCSFEHSLSQIVIWEDYTRTITKTCTNCLGGATGEHIIPSAVRQTSDLSAGMNGNLELQKTVTSVDEQKSLLFTWHAN